MYRLLSRVAALAAAFVVGVSLVPVASGQGFSPEQMHERLLAQVDATVKALDFKGETADTVRAILMERGQKRFEMFSSLRQSGGGREAMTEAMNKLNEETEARMAQVLDEKQLAAWKKYEAENPPMRRRRGGG